MAPTVLSPTRRITTRYESSYSDITLSYLNMAATATRAQSHLYPRSKVLNRTVVRQRVAHIHRRIVSVLGWGHTAMLAISRFLSILARGDIATQ